LALQVQAVVPSKLARHHRYVNGGCDEMIGSALVVLMELCQTVLLGSQLLRLRLPAAHYR
jgi:hypothetical protein